MPIYHQKVPQRIYTDQEWIHRGFIFNFNFVITIFYNLLAVMDNHHRSMKICKQTKNNFTKLICAKRDFAFWNAIQTLTWVYPAIILFIVKLIGHWIWCTRSRPVSFFINLLRFYSTQTDLQWIKSHRSAWFGIFPESNSKLNYSGNQKIDAALFKRHTR